MVSGALVALLCLAAGPARADRLGGAYRGPYNDRQATQNTDDPTVETSGQATADPPPDAGSKNGDGGAATDGSGGSETPPPDGGDPPPDGGSPDPGGVGGDGGSTGNKPPPQPSGTPSGPGTNIAGGNSLDGGKKGKVAVDDVYAFWPFWFEHNKEWILGELLRARTARTRVPPGSSPAIFTLADSNDRQRTPVTEDMKLKQIYPVLEASLTDSSSWVRDAAALALGKLGAPEAIGPLTARLSDNDPDIQEDALLALGLTGHKDALKPLMDTLGGTDPNRKAFAALGLGLLGFRESVPVLSGEFAAMTRSPKTKEVAACIAVAMGMLGDESAVKNLGQSLKSRVEPEVKMHVCQALGRIGGADAFSWLQRAFNVREKAVGAAAALAMSNFPDAQAVSFLLKNGLKSSDKMTKLYSIVSLGRIGRALLPDDKLRKAMIKDLKETAESPMKDKYTAMYATLGLAIMGDKSANDFFLEHLAEDNRAKWSKETHSAMAMALGLLEDKRSIRDLREIVVRGRVEDDYRGYAALALGIMGDVASKDTILRTMEDEKKKRDLLRSGCWAVGLLGEKKDIPSLIGFLEIDGADKHEVRGAAAIAIGLIGDSSAVAPLLKIVRDDTSPQNRAFAIAALGCLIDKDPVPRIPQIFMNTHFREEMGIAHDVLMNL
jgi:HEAT repeat protein